MYPWDDVETRPGVQSVGFVVLLLLQFSVVVAFAAAAAVCDPLPTEPTSKDALFPALAPTVGLLRPRRRQAASAFAGANIEDVIQGLESEQEH